MMTTQQAADRLGVHVETVRRWIRAGKLKAQRLPVGRWGKPEYRIPEEAIAEFLGDQSRDDQGGTLD